MSHESRIHTLRQKFAVLDQEIGELKQLRKSAFLAAPAMPQGGQPQMDPAMMQQQGAPPVDPATGQPMDPAMMQQGGPPVDPNTGQPMADPAAAAPPIDPALIDQIVGLLEEMGQKVQQQGEQLAQFQQSVTGELQDLGDQLSGLEKQNIMSQSAAAAAKPADAAW